MAQFAFPSGNHPVFRHEARDAQPSSLPHNLPASLTEQDLTGRWVAVEPGNGLVDYDTELDLLCQRVAAAGLSRLTIFKYEGPEDGYSGPRGSA